MAAASGQYGKAEIGSSCIAEVDRWSLNKECILHDFATCETPSDGGTAVIAGRKKHSGSMSGIYDPADPVEDYFEEGDTVTLNLYYTASLYYTGSVVIENIQIPDVDIAEGAPLRWEAAFRANGLFTKSA